MERVKQWLDQAKVDLKAAKDNVRTENYQWAAFLSQQVAEKALKALYINKYKKLWKIHDLVALAEKVNAPEKIVEACDALNPHYLVSRYPVGIDVKYTKEDANEAVKYAKEVIEWARKQI